jgi:hypothetical protein
MRGVGRVLDGSGGSLMLLSLTCLLGVPGLLRGRHILGAPKITAMAGRFSVIVVIAVGVVRVVVHIVAHIDR